MSFKDITLIVIKSDLSDSNCGMASGSHSQTLVRWYAWDKKLYEEVKIGDQTGLEYDKKHLKLKNEDGLGADSRRQLIELLHGLSETWNIMLESNESQKQVISQVTSFICPSYGRFNSHSQRDVTQKLEDECFKIYIAEQRAYVEVLNGWLSKFSILDTEYHSRKTSIRSISNVAHPLVTMAHNWFMCSKGLPDKAVTYAMKAFIKDIRALWEKQGEETPAKEES